MLRNMNIVECPCCGAVPVKIELEVAHDQKTIRQHVNGQRWERVTFLCGCSLEWSPNFGRAEVKIACPKYGNQADIILARRRFVEALTLQVKAAEGIDEPFRALLLDKLHIHKWDMENVTVDMRLNRDGTLK